MLNLQLISSFYNYFHFRQGVAGLLFPTHHGMWRRAKNAAEKPYKSKKIRRKKSTDLDILN